MQSQDATAGLLSARARTRGLTLDSTRRARLEERSVVRTWAMRGTLHFLAAEDVGWMLGLFGPLYEARDRRRLDELGLDTAAVDRGVQLIRSVLADRGPTTREPIRAALGAAGIPHEGQVVQHLLYVAALRGVICCSDDRGGGTYQFALLDDWVERGPALSRPAALEELARRYLAMAAPATVDDFAAWSGLPARDAREGWEAIRDERVAIDTAAGSMSVPRGWAPERGKRTPIVRLLPRFDTYLLSYRGRGLAVDPEYARRVLPGGGILNATVLLDGRLVGTWQLKRGKREATVVVDLFRPVSPAVRHVIEVDAADVGRFFGVSTTLALEGPNA